MRKIAAILVLSLLVPTGTAIAGPIKDAATRAGRDMAVQPVAEKNPYRTGSLILIGGGAALLVLGLMQERGVEVGGDVFDGSVSAKETGGSKTALTFLGGAAIAGGIGLYFWGENKKNAVRPQISANRNGVAVSASFGF